MICTAIRESQEDQAKAAPEFYAMPVIPGTLKTNGKPSSAVVAPEPKLAGN
jgi:hypothetical protein